MKNRPHLIDVKIRRPNFLYAAQSRQTSWPNFGNCLAAIKEDRQMSEPNTTARALAECAFKQQVAGRWASAERLLAEARSLDAAEVAAVLREHSGTAHAETRARASAERVSA
jgi:hypothetical protein